MLGSFGNEEPGGKQIRTSTVPSGKDVLEMLRVTLAMGRIIHSHFRQAGSVAEAASDSVGQSRFMRHHPEGESPDEYIDIEVLFGKCVQIDFKKSE
ncbi:hypothetical protein Cob_v006565 [Colletotrichum orbiculare MAFF 240422]|uniref:Uncharacterized protein n=1 Tax=Colletotrichum orbiculare (strain 104-T / ATCC 96160 / CBS 514.97 / LARS 414 / MAFF 240422) TaxID=1213857 RepID=A0A484FR24_COLOR|nr:hypothetical protein Cob_v006565 [Colletotrichum orbiculare MAFF 240422]